MRQSYRVSNLDLILSSFAIEGWSPRPASKVFQEQSLLTRKSKVEVDSELT
jgi:hypothetical protein